MFRLLDKSRTVAPYGYNRWLIPPAALCVHLCIGQIYAYSVFNNPLTRLIGITQPAGGDWDLKEIGWIFSIALCCLGLSSGLFGKWVERVGPRKTMFVSAICFSGGFFISAWGVEIHNLWLLYLGNGLIGGIGLGLGYISPVSTLIKWFPDRPGMATGMAIMGFGGGAMVASPLSVRLMTTFGGDGASGVTETFLALGCLYFLLMMFGAAIVRIPAPGWIPQGYVPPQTGPSASKGVRVEHAIRTPQFWLLVMVLVLNVTAGIGILGQASVMIQEIFSEASAGKSLAVNAEAAAGFVGLLSLFNMAGRFAWSSLSDRIGRKNTYTIFFLLGATLYALIPAAGNAHSKVMFVSLSAVALSMYGGGFATIPAYIRDLFGGIHVGAIHGRVLLGWSLAALLGPVLMNYMRSWQIETLGVPKAQAYETTMYIMTGVLLTGAVMNLLIRPVDEKLFEEIQS